MKSDKSYLELYGITERSILKKLPIENAVEEAIKGGVTCIQVREKNSDFDEFVSIASKIKAITEKYNIPLIINDDIDVMLEVDGDGIHIGQDDISLEEVKMRVGADKIIGVSARTYKEAYDAYLGGADYIGVGAMYSTATKTDANIVEMKVLEKICNEIPIPVVIIGGINRNTIENFEDINIDGVSIVSDIFGSDNVFESSKELKKLTNTYVKKQDDLKKVLTIAGSDCSGGAGIQADIKTISSYGQYAMSVITSITAQNTQGVTNIENVDVKMVKDQLDAIFTDIRPDAIKIGMVSNKEIILAICEKLKQYNCENIVYDPVMVSTSGAKLLEDDTVDVIIENLLPLATIITPNIYEAEVLAKIKIDNENHVKDAINKIAKYYKGSILIKGGHLKDSCNDLLFDGGEIHFIKGDKIDNKNTHGTGCTLSSAIACNLAKNESIINSVKNSKNFITKAIDKMLDLGKGRGPLNHFVSTTSNSLYEKLVEDNKLTWEDYINHKIKDGLVYEKIDIEKFKMYIKQDYMYILEYKKYSELLFEESGIELFKIMAESCEGEKELHSQYVDNFDNIKLAKETLDYTNYFHDIFEKGTFEEKVIALAPCFIGYALFCKNISKHNVSENNKYYKWIEAYNADGYIDKVFEYINLIDSLDIGDNFTRLSVIFKEVSDLEVRFFNQLID